MTRAESTGEEIVQNRDGKVNHEGPCGTTEIPVRFSLGNSCILKAEQVFSKSAR